MEKICEFCAALKPIVYCKADAAFLCLSCDAKVHSANTLSNRHLRTLLCDSCRNRPAYARCLDHKMFVCYSCDKSIHGGLGSSSHQKRILSSYTGCPSAKDFASLWGFSLDEFDKFGGQDNEPRIGSTSKPNYSGFVSGAPKEVGFGCKQNEKLLKGQKQQNIGFILQQILELKKLELTEMDNSLGSPVLEQTDISSLVRKASEKIGQSVNPLQHCRHSDSAHCMLQDSLALPFSQPEYLLGPTASANPIVGESFWQCKSPTRSGQLWSQNMQDLGVCEDVLCQDDFNIPDVDITFRNFEELFATEQDPNRALIDEKDMSLDTSHNRNSEKLVDTSTMNKDFAFLGSLDNHEAIRPSYSTRSLSLSRFSVDNIGIECLDSELSPFISEAEVSCRSADLERLLSDANEVTMTRYTDKKNGMKEKQTRYAPWKAGSDARKRVKGRIGKTEDYDSDSIDVTRSY